MISKTKAKVPRKYLAFDLETAKDFPGEASDWTRHRPLGIACAATLASDAEQPQLWHSKTAAGTPAERMSAVDVIILVDHLRDMATQGYIILTWNGASFDFDILAEESASHEHCRACTWDHVDMMFHLVCILGYPVSLEKAAEGLGLPGKSAGMSGALAPKLWAKGEHQKVLDYAAQDVRVTLQIALECERLKQFAWITQRGMKNTKPLTRGWLTVREALKLPLPDTSWMKTPLLRTEFVGWLGAE